MRAECWSAHQVASASGQAKKNPASTAERGSNRVNMTWELCGRPVYRKHNMVLTALQAKSDRLRLRLWA